MKRLLFVTLIFSLPLSAFAESELPARLQQVEDRPVLTPVERAELDVNRSVEIPDNSLQERQAAREARRQHIEELRQRKPKNPVEAIEVHETVLTERIEQLEDNEQIPEEKKADLINTFTEELNWVQEKNTALKEAETPEERQSIREEIITHVRTVKTERRQALAETVKLPQESPRVIAEEISDRFTQISARLQTAGKDTAELDTALAQYQQAVIVLDSSYAAVQAEKTVETLQNLRDSIKAVRDAGNAVRNSIQSIVSY